jgi:hypothetical protein
VLVGEAGCGGQAACVTGGQVGEGGPDRYDSVGSLGDAEGYETSEGSRYRGVGPEVGAESEADGEVDGVDGLVGAGCG